MRRKWVLIGAVVVFGLASSVVLGLVLCFPRTPFRDSFTRVRIGMIEDELHAIMGDRIGLIGPDYYGGPRGSYGEVYETGAEGAIIWVANGRVVGKRWESAHEGTILLRPLGPIRDRLGW